ncbi:MAG TPA: hypothetical protein VNT76_20355, partial [Candidatus Binatus sp.]|nr:hypothetical protein [Candidatus Binatus sp.]
NVVAIGANSVWTAALIAKLQIADISTHNGVARIKFHTFSGQSYSVEYSPNLQPGSWLALPGGNLQGTGLDLIIEDPTAANAGTRFYRVKLIP